MLVGMNLAEPDHSLSSDDAERTIRRGDGDLARCRADRNRYRQAWPTAPAQEKE